MIVIFLQCLFIATPLMIGCALRDAYLHYKGKGRVDKIKKTPH